MSFKEAFLSGAVNKIIRRSARRSFRLFFQPLLVLPWLIKKVDPMILMSVGYAALVVLIVKVFGE